MNIFALSGLLIFVSSIAFGTFVLYRSIARKEAVIWFLFCVSVSIWGLGAYKIGTSIEAEQALIWWRIAHIGVIFIPVFFLHYVSLFLRINSKKYLWLNRITYSIGFLFLFFNLFTQYFIQNIRLVFNSIYYNSPPTMLYIVFCSWWIIMIIFIHYKLAQYFSFESGRKKQQIKYFFLATIVGFLGGMTVFLPVFGIDIYPYLNMTVVLYPAIMAYAIIKYDLMSIRLILINSLMIMLNVFAVGFIFISDSLSEYIARSIFAIMILILSYFLYKSFDKEVKQKEELLKLSNDLRRANTELKRLDKAKSEFISIASHQLRTPLTAIKGYISLILEGAYGTDEQKKSDALNKIFLANERLIQLVEDLLNITRIESGRLEYHLEDNVKIDEIVKELEGMFILRAQEKKLEFIVSIPKKGISPVKADKTKLREVISNIIDNAVKYTKEGFIHISVTESDKIVRVIVEDSGVGISKESLQTLFAKFSRGTDSTKIYTEGTGLGLYVGKNLIESQGGHIYAESEGLGKGSRFIIEMPIA
jgi:signal transduction histidine kinase